MFVRVKQKYLNKKTKSHAAHVYTIFIGYTNVLNRFVNK